LPYDFISQTEKKMFKSQVALSKYLF